MTGKQMRQILGKVKKMVFKSKKFDELTTTELYEILKARAKIFIMEQHINYLDMDDVDYKSLHCFFEDNGKVVAYLRAFYEDNSRKSVKIGRVLTMKHGCGTGKALMEQSVIAISSKMNCSKICMDAQKYAAGFYERFGFKVASGDFLEEGIVHIVMELEV